MKKIVFNEMELNHTDVLKQVLGGAGSSGINLDQMRRRIRVMDIVEASSSSEMVLEDADYDVLRGAYNSFQFGVVHRDLISIAASIDAAESVKISPN